ncbi:MAG TPA: PLP-dependent aminotransferase family protein [Alphaproteobacteria bacterium]|nr:PLP-dependent aminotransferase family protein [Alphaproteobacteria bacterium]
MARSSRPRASTRRDSTALLDNLALDESAPGGRARQIYRALQTLILSGALKPGTKLPSTRTLARHLELARTTVIAAFELLAAEGYIEGAHGSGTYVSRALERELLGKPPRRALAKAQTAPRLASRGQFIRRLAAAPGPPSLKIFAPGIPTLDAFPFEEWRRLLARVSRREGRRLFYPADPRGWPALRQAIAAYLGPARGVVCEPHQVIILSSSRQAVDLAARLLADPGDTVWTEEPGYPESRAALEAAGLALAFVPVDAEGLSTADGRRLAPHAKLASVTPSHHYPLGTTMSLARRLDLLAWARSADAVVVEDDFNGEFRYGGRPLTALYGLDGGERVIYTGTFSRAMFPALRLAYLVSPAPLSDAFVRARGQLDGYAVTITQAAVAEFMAAGSFAAHIRRMRALYKERQDTLVELAKRHLKGALELEPSDAGLHLVGRLPPGISDEDVALALADTRVAPGVLSRFYGAGRTPKPAPSGLLLNYAAWAAAELREGVIALARAIEAVARPR